MSGCGVVFRVAPDGHEKALHAFTGGTDGAVPQASLIADSMGNLFGTTGGGGSTDCQCCGCGTVFELAADGTETVLYAFAHERKSGGHPYAGLIKHKAGLYGTTEVGGSTGCGGRGCGTVFRLTK